jgi:hypothetical protein
VEKRDAVVSAFKVRGFFRYIYFFSLIRPSACMVGLRYDYSSLIKMTATSPAFSSERDAMGSDEYHPISQKGTNLTKAGGIGYTVIDSIDTMQIMGLEEEYARARDWVATKLSFDRDDNFNTFEVFIIPLSLFFFSILYRPPFGSLEAYFRLIIYRLGILCTSNEPLSLQTACFLSSTRHLDSQHP